MNASGQIDLSPLEYDHQCLVAEMQDEGIPQEFVETVRTGWWTTCLEILPVKERIMGRFKTCPNEDNDDAASNPT